jgi:hypothetical protein
MGPDNEYMYIYYSASSLMKILLYKVYYKWFDHLLDKCEKVQHE